MDADWAYIIRQHIPHLPDVTVERVARCIVSNIKNAVLYDEPRQTVNHSEEEYFQGKAKKKERKRKSGGETL